MKTLLKEFLRYTFSDRREQIYDVDEVNIVEGDSERNKQQDILYVYSKTKNRIITIISFVLVVICLGSFAIIVYQSLFYPEAKIPEIIQNAFTSTVGYFVGVFGAFLKERT